MQIQPDNVIYIRHQKHASNIAKPSKTSALEGVLHGKVEFWQQFNFAWPKVRKNNIQSKEISQ